MSDKENWGETLKNIGTSNEGSQKGSNLPKFGVKTISEGMDPKFGSIHSEFELKREFSERNKDKE